MWTESGRRKTCHGNLKKRDNLEGLGVDGNIILKYILKKEAEGHRLD
jgi:hypothetical protein